jgi:hypothetical protein
MSGPVFGFLAGDGPGTDDYFLRSIKGLAKKTFLL